MCSIQKQKDKGEKDRMLKTLNLNSRFEGMRYGLIAFATTIAMVLSLLAPLILQGSADASTLSSRSVTIATSEPDVTGVSYSFNFTTVDTPAPIQSIVLQFCDTPLGTCVLPGTDGTPSATETIDVDESTASFGSISGWTNATNFADFTGADTGACDDADTGSGVSTMFCLTRTQAANETDGAKTLVINNITNPIVTNVNYEEIYVRISLYQTTGFATLVDDGIVAANVVNLLTVTGRVQERLVFCVFALDDTAGSNSGSIGLANNDYPTSCSAFEATESSNVDLGVVDNTSLNARSPVNNSPPTSIGNDKFGAAIVNTNASNGVTVGYYPDIATSGTNQLRTFRVTGASCNASNANLTDQCFQNAATTGTTYSVGSERFGLHMACIANSTTIAAGTTSNLGSGGEGSATSGGTYNTAYDDESTAASGNLADTGADDCENATEDNFYAWDDSGTLVPLVHSATVVDDELIKMRFAATAEATTPTGTYTAASIFIATPVF